MWSAWRSTRSLRRAESGQSARLPAESASASGVFIEVFTDEVGITPKLFCRIQRFHLAFSAVQESGPVNWARLAADCGYFDQSHLIRDFLEFSGLTPADYFNRQNHFRRRELYLKRNHIPLAA